MKKLEIVIDRPVPTPHNISQAYSHFQFRTLDPKEVPMARTICPHCKYDSATDKIVLGAAKGAGVGLLGLLNPILGAAALTGLALKAWLDSDSTEVKCPNCGKYYHTD